LRHNGASGSAQPTLPYSDVITNPEYASIQQDSPPEPVIHSPPPDNSAVYSQVNKRPPPPKTPKPVTAAAPPPPVTQTPLNPYGDEAVLYADLQTDNRPRSRPVPPKRTSAPRYDESALYDPITKG